MDFDYKTYSLSKLEDWVCDAISTGEATPQEIYDTIRNVVQEQYDYYKNGAEKTNELLSLLNGHNDQIQFNFDTSDYINFDTMCGAEGASDYYNSFWGDDVIKEDKVTKWRLPVEVDDAAGDADPIYYVNFPDDLLEAANLKEGDKVEWVDNENGSYLLRKV
jgi:hypothetical protein